MLPRVIQLKVTGEKNPKMRAKVVKLNNYFHFKDVETDVERNKDQRLA